ncbi:hypothetical protein [Streptomyces sp. HC307]
MRLVTDSMRFRRILRIVRLSGVFELHPTLRAALVRTLQAVSVPAVAG